MANRWTGAFDAVIELSPKGADVLLAAVHRKGEALPGATGPHLAHSLAFNLPLAGSNSTRNLRGHLQAQISTPSISIPAGPEGRVTASVEVYAWFQRGPGSDPAPEFLHGTLAITTGVRVIECSGSTLAEIQIAHSGAQVAFTPAAGSGTSAADVRLVNEVAADVLRNALKPVQFRVPSLGSGDFGVHHFGFKTVREGSRAGMAVLLGFRDGAAPSPAGVSEVFLSLLDDAAFALGKEFLSETLKKLAAGPLSNLPVSGSRFGVSFSAVPDPATLEITLLPGRIRAQIGGKGSLSPGGSFRFRLTQDFGLKVSGGNLVLTLADEPRLDITQANTLLDIVFGIFKGKIIDKIQVAASGLIQVASAALNEIVDRSIEDVLDGLEVPGVTLRFRRTAIDGDAVILGGAFGVGSTPPPVASFTNQITRPAGAPVSTFAREFDALASWIPGGTIQRYKWTENRPRGQQGLVVTDEHRFLLRVPTSSGPLTQVVGWPPYYWCLEVSGTQFVGTQDAKPVSKTVCGLSVLVPAVDLSRLGGRLTLQVSDGNGGVRADLDPWGKHRPHSLARSNDNRGVLLVHHAGDAVDDAVRTLRAVFGDKNQALPVFPTLLVPGRANGYAPGRAASDLSDLAITNDPEGAWRERFGLERPGATVIFGPGGKELWRDAGPLRADTLAKVVAGLKLDGARTPRWMPVRLGLGLGTLAPDLLFPCGINQTSITLSKLRGREVDLAFWTTWSEASLEELRRRAAAERENKGGPLLLCVNDGEDPAVAARVLKEKGISVELVADPNRNISRKYGITCWPTVVRVDAEGRVAAARFGLEHEHARDYEQKAVTGG